MFVVFGDIQMTVLVTALTGGMMSFLKLFVSSS